MVLAGDAGSVGGGSESWDGSGGAAGSEAAAMISGGAGAGAATVTGGGKTERFGAAGAVSAGTLVAWVVTFVTPSSGRGSDSHPAGRPAAAGGWKSNGAAPTAGR